MFSRTINGFGMDNFVEDGKGFLINPWAVMSMIDLYTEITLSSMWIDYYAFFSYGDVS